jgi:hypothetical protein
MDHDLQKLEKIALDIRYLKDRQEILDCIYRYPRGIDRRDRDILESVYHPDGIDEHGTVVTTGLTFPDWVYDVHEKAHHSHQHHITNHTCEITGDTSHCESYVIYLLVSKNQKTLDLGGGRYIDRIERRNGEWRIAHRRTVIEWQLGAESTVDKLRKLRGYLDGTRNREDSSYERPLTVHDYGTE